MSSDAVTEGGILAPADAVDDLQKKLRGTSQAMEAYDPDGRRRVVLTRDETKLIDRLLIMMGRLGVGMVYCCSQHPESRFQRDAQDRFIHDDTTKQPILKPGWKPRCLKLITPEDQDGSNPGYGCDCTRIHIQHERGAIRKIR